jgi:uncharacterized protein YecT (DUF1311 family)
MKKFFLIIFLFIGFLSNSQTIKTIEKIEKKHQNCLDKESFMLGCSLKYNKQMDSLLNLVYNKKRQKMNPVQKTAFKKEQQLWLQKRDTYIKKIIQKTKAETDLIGNDLQMIITNQEADFVKKRVLELIQKM